MNPLNDPAAVRLAAGELEATFLPTYGMLGASLRHRGEELLRRIEDLEAAASKGSTAGIPLLHPWANRLNGRKYRAAGREVALDVSSRLLHLDSNGLPIHGVGWPLLKWEVTEVTGDRVVAILRWSRDDLLEVFPFRHQLEMAVTLRRDDLTIATTLVAAADGPAPVSFGFHPYFGIPDLPRSRWQITLPAMNKLLLDGQGIPTGKEAPFAAFDGPLGEQTFDDGFVALDQRPAFSLAGGGRRITVEFVAGYAYAQLFAPPGKDFIAIEPMTAPTNALISGRGLALVEPRGRYQATFRIGVTRIV